jgi:polysaccharide biosynthesis transport protein
MKDLKNLEFDEYWSIFWKRRWYLIITTVIVIAGVSIFAWQTPDLFRSETRLKIENPYGMEEGSRPGPVDNVNAIAMQIESRTFLEKIIEQFQLNNARSGSAMEKAVKALRKQIQVEKTSDDTFKISYLSTDSQNARDVLTRVAEEVIRLNSAVRMDKAVSANQFYDDQLRQAAQELSDQEEKIRQFKMNHLGELPEQSASNTSTLSGLYSQLTVTEAALQQARDQQQALEYRMQERKRLNILAQSIANEAVPKLGESVDKSSSAIETELVRKQELRDVMLSKYTDKHPDMQLLSQQIKDLEQQLKAKTPASGASAASAGDSGEASSGQPANAKLQQSAAELDSSSFAFDAEAINHQIEKREKDRAEIQRQMKLVQSKLNLAPALEQEMASLLRERESLQNQYNRLKNRKFDTQIRATMETEKKYETYKIVDKANLPIVPELPNRLQIFLIGIVGAFLCGVGAAFGRELIDSSIGSEEEASKILDLPVLVSICEISDSGKSISKPLRLNAV